jgi:hypothetical protein
MLVVDLFISALAFSPIFAAACSTCLKEASSYSEEKRSGKF